MTAFPSPCPFCQHTRNGEGICQCPPDCPSCRQGCCGRINWNARAIDGPREYDLELDTMDM
jgi:hypothetical protein